MNRRQILKLSAASFTAGMTGCTLNADYDHDGADAPRFDPSLIKPARIAWVLSSGGPRGFVHIGVLRALEELHLKPDLIVGGSVGALVGALYACGMGAVEMERMALDLGVSNVGRLAVKGDGKFAGTPIADLVNHEVHHLPIEKLPIRFAAAALERESRRPILFNAGNCGVAVQASAAIEGIFTPVRIRGVQYVDADLAAPLPVRLARSLGAIKVLAIDASAHEEHAPAGSEHFREGDLRKRALTEPDARNADLTLHPEFSYYVSTKREFRENTLRAGYIHAMAHAAQLKALHS
jgi:NTE family protein